MCCFEGTPGEKAEEETGRESDGTSGEGSPEAGPFNQACHRQHQTRRVAASQYDHPHQSQHDA
jgi:hypothetical protein